MQAAKLVAALLRVAAVTAGLAESNGSLPSGLWLFTSPADWVPRTGISSGTLLSVIEYGLPLPILYPLTTFPEEKARSETNTEPSCNCWTICFAALTLRHSSPQSAIVMCKLENLSDGKRPLSPSIKPCSPIYMYYQDYLNKTHSDYLPTQPNRRQFGRDAKQAFSPGNQACFSP